MSFETTLPIPLDLQAYNVSLEVFEGPLDLLLHLIQKHELDILDIPVAFVTEKYLEYMALMDSLNLDVASEYLLMAATLTYIKSRELLPPDPSTQDPLANDGIGELEEDPRTALIRRLLEYQKFKLAGEELAARGIAGRDIFGRGADLREQVSENAPLAPVPLHALLEAFQRILARQSDQTVHVVTEERISIADRIHTLVDRLKPIRTCTFESLFDDVQNTHELVVTFLALLEMTRLHMTRLYQSSALSTIHITLVLEDIDPEALASVD
ncbi:MAG: segregation/condensation protein A [Deltaproteobacteria bacterium]|nr:segregation/condensation protein A [Deltaproteobacteria bacterium]